VPNRAPWLRYGGMFTIEGWDLWAYNDAADAETAAIASSETAEKWWSEVRGTRKRLVWIAHFGPRFPPFSPRQRLHVEPYGRWELELHYRSTRRRSEIATADFRDWARRDLRQTLELFARTSALPPPPLSG
jgi:hypothetical protein